MSFDFASYVVEQLKKGRRVPMGEINAFLSQNKQVSLAVLRFAVLSEIENQRLKGAHVDALVKRLESLKGAGRSMVLKRKDLTVNEKIRVKRVQKQEPESSFYVSKETGKVKVYTHRREQRERQAVDEKTREFSGLTNLYAALLDSGFTEEQARKTALAAVKSASSSGRDKLSREAREAAIEFWKPFSGQKVFKKKTGRNAKR